MFVRFVLDLLSSFTPYLATYDPQALSDLYLGLQISPYKVSSKSDLIEPISGHFVRCGIIYAELTYLGANYSTLRVFFQHFSKFMSADFA